MVLSGVFLIRGLLRLFGIFGPHELLYGVFVSLWFCLVVGRMGLLSSSVG